MAIRPLSNSAFAAPNRPSARLTAAIIRASLTSRRMTDGESVKPEGFGYRIYAKRGSQPRFLLFRL
jgi:hypothetical protein